MRMLGFVLEYLTPQCAADKNRTGKADDVSREMPERDAKVLEILIQEGYFRIVIKQLSPMALSIRLAVMTLLTNTWRGGETSGNRLEILVACRISQRTVPPLV